jgi:hypothetical protein
VAYFSAVENITAKTPPPPHNSPHSHDKFTTSKPHKIAEPLQITATPPQSKFIPRKTGTQIDSTPLFPAKIHVFRVYTEINMSSSTISPSISADEFQALEQKVLRAVEVVKREREARATAEAEVASLRAQLAEQQGLNTMVESELTTLTKEREAVRQRVEKMLQQMDELL